MKANNFDEYLNNELKAMNILEFSRMQGARKETLSNGAALVTDTQGYYYLPTSDGKQLVVFVYLQSNTSSKLVFDQILSTFKFTR